MLAGFVSSGMGLISSEDIKRLTVICVIHCWHITAGLFAALSVSVIRRWCAIKAASCFRTSGLTKLSALRVWFITCLMHSVSSLLVAYSA